ncbi:DUF427 domain-containing protein [Thalassovita sp.]|jgi:uncharacterized protein (DUF427 family)|uniref:DUF427 domain-containing protein n=1 Tax=Thalassovita sp. TaxID=1979401 RepID=UPI003B5A9A28
MSKDMTIRNAEGTWVVRAGGAVLGETRKALELNEEGLASVVYFPRDDIAMAFLDKTEKVTHCPKKGDASHYSIVTKSTTLKDAAWSYEAPLDAAERIKGYLAFYPSDTLAVERL